MLSTVFAHLSALTSADTRVHSLHRYRFINLFSSFNLIPLTHVDLGQEVCDYVLLPVVDGTVSFDLFLSQLSILDVHASVICEVTKGDFVDFFSEQLLLGLGSFQKALHGLLSTHRS